MTNTWSGFDGSVDETEDAIRSRFDGNAVPVVGGYGDCMVTANTGGTRTVDVAAGITWAHRVRAKMDAGAVSFDVVATSGQTRWDAVVHRRDWSANTVTLMKVNGISAVNAPEVAPAGLNDNPGVLHDQVLALVQTTYGASVPTTVRDWRLMSSKVITASSLGALPVPTAMLYGLEAVAAGIRYRCQLDTSNAAAWVNVSSNYTEVSANLFGSGPGWSASGLASLGRRSTTTRDAELDLQTRRTGATLAASSTGNFPDTLVCTFPEEFWPDRQKVVAGQYAGGTGFGWTGFTGILGTDGRFILQSGTAGMDLVTRPGSGAGGAVTAADISLRAHLRYLRKA